MSAEQLPNGRWRAKVWHDGRSYPVAKVLGLGAKTWPTESAALKAEGKAKAVLENRAPSAEMTIGEFWKLWTTDPLYARPKESTNIHNRERTKAFAEAYAKVKISQTDRVVAEWLAGGARNGTVPALRAMFTDAMSAKAGRLIDHNPFANLGIAKTKGRKDIQPPTQEQLAEMIRIAREITPPSFAAYLEFASCTAARPSELDALRWARVRIEDGEVDLFEQWNAKTRTLTPPKYGPYTVALTGRARDVLLGIPLEERDSEFVFTTLRGTHYTPSSRTHHWNRVRCAAGLPDMELYLATRHYFAWYALNVLELEPHIIAEQLGHKDGGRLIVRLYGHLDAKKARRRIREAFDATAPVTALRVVRGGKGA